MPVQHRVALEQTDDVSVFRVWLWPHRLLLLGPGFRAELHRHHAIQIGLGLDRPVRLRIGRELAWQQARGFSVPADLQHAFDAQGTRVLMLYLEPESAEGRNWLAAQGMDVRPRALPDRLAKGVDVPACCAAAEGLVDSWLNAAAAETLPLDARISAALALIDSELSSAGLRQAALARAVHLSSSHFGQLFSRQLGLPLRRYILWRRLRKAVEYAAKGTTLTAAAHAAGFADSAHLSRTFRMMFGLPPALFFGGRGLARVEFCGEA